MASSPSLEDSGASQGAQIFDGLSFWVSNQVPMRKSILDNITDNGGQVVKLENQADYRIADHAKKNAPPASLSWNFIVDSVKYGCVQLTDHYSIGPDPDAPRPAGSHGAARKLRVGYSREDDAALARWVVANNVGPLMGNHMYKDFEKENSRHTWQSWRNRFKTKLQPMGWEAIERLAGTRPPPNDSVHDAARQDNKAFSPSSASKRNDDAHEKHFWKEFEIYVDVCEVEIEPHHSIERKTISLWQLYRAVETQAALVGEVDWFRVATELGYRVTPNSTVPRRLQSCYDANLAEFCDSMHAQTPQEDEEGGEAPGYKAGQVADRGTSHQELPQQSPAQEASDQDESESEAFGTPLPGRASPSTKKRALDFGSARETINQAKRRQRYGPEAEIPSTPDEIIGLGRRPSVEATPSSRGASQQQRLVEDTDGSIALTRSLTKQNTGDVTPSQQLQRENWAVSPIPLRLDLAPRSGQGEAGVERQASPSQHVHNEAPRPSLRDTTPAGYGPSPPKVAKPMKQGSPQKDQLESIEDWVEHYQSLGYTHDVVVQGLRRTTMKPGGLATLVMERISKGEGVPSHYAGIWTDDDDESLWLADHYEAREEAGVTKMAKRAAKEMRRLLRKHGRQGIDLRRRFLDAQSNM
ncbi:hypothetical protein CDD81_888 [Ophiocordyceps australis]|uniref:DNA-binding protein RAP1 n=1 Tax=Ophiocordyceps australis TaxID=1399860 RepID=A0A2C5YEN9_9HYPO|nr:hypothetical protein CDD81_888 [Ophiocordyceps australis]